MKIAIALLSLSLNATLGIAVVEIVGAPVAPVAMLAHPHAGAPTATQVAYHVAS